MATLDSTDISNLFKLDFMWPLLNKSLHTLTHSKVSFYSWQNYRQSIKNPKSNPKFFETDQIWFEIVVWEHYSSSRVNQRNVIVCQFSIFPQIANKGTVNLIVCITTWGPKRQKNWENRSFLAELSKSHKFSIYRVSHT